MPCPPTRPFLRLCPSQRLVLLRITFRPGERPPSTCRRWSRLPRGALRWPETTSPSSERHPDSLILVVTSPCPFRHRSSRLAFSPSLKSAADRGGDRCLPREGIYRTHCWLIQRGSVPGVAAKQAGNARE